LIWNSTRGTATTINNGLGAVAPSGSRRVFVGSSTTYTLSVMGATDTARVSASVTVLPTETPLDVNVLTNSGFEVGDNSWIFSTDGQGSFAVDTPGCGSQFAAKVMLETVGTTAQLYQVGFPLDPNSTYRLSFEGCSTSGKDLEISIHQHDEPFANYGLQPVVFNLTEEFGTHQAEFTTTNLSCTATDARLRLWFSPYASPGEVYRLDNFSLIKVVPLPTTLAVPSVSFPSLIGDKAPVSFTVTWSSAAGADMYHYQLASDIACDHILLDDSTLATSTTIGPLNYERTYYFRIRSLGPTKASPFSSVYAFTTVAGPVGPPPVDYALVQNYPNPFNGQTWIRFSLPVSAEVRLVVYDVLGGK